MSSLMPLQEALEHITQTLDVITSTESVPLLEALGRVLACDIESPINVPPAANSAMDGYAVRCSDLASQSDLIVSQRIAAGQPPSPLAENSCARIFTGAEIPAGADAVVMQEHTEIQGDRIHFLKTVVTHQNIRPAGQDIAKGMKVLSQGKRLNAIDIGVLASIGVADIRVYCPLKVGILTTGDELQSPDAALQPGQIYNSNGPLMTSLVQSAGHQVCKVMHANDSVADTEQALQALSEQCDIILSSGGVSVGEEDHVKNTIERNGALHLWKIAIKPGKPLVFANVFNTPFIGLPGNPSSTLVTFHLFARLAFAKAAGEHLTLPTPYPVTCHFSRKGNQSRDEFLRVYVQNGIATPHTQQSSGALLAASQTDGYLHVPAKHDITPDSKLNFYPFDSF